MSDMQTKWKIRDAEVRNIDERLKLCRNKHRELVREIEDLERRRNIAARDKELLERRIGHGSAG